MNAATSPPHTRGAATEHDAVVGTASSRRAWWAAYAHHLRLLRTQSIVWIAMLAAVGAGFIVAFEETYASEAERQAVAATVEGVPAFEALFGRTVALDTLEGFVLWRWGGFAVLLVAFWGMLSASRLLRGAEDAGHLEVLRAGVVSPRGLLGTALAALFTVHLALAVTVGVSYTAAGMDAATAWMLGTALALLTATFAAATTLACQLVGSRRRANGLVGGVLGAALAVRGVAAGSASPDWLWWATPFGWTGYLHEVDAARLTVLAAFAATISVLVAVAFVLARRDLGAAHLESGERPATRVRPVGGQAGLAVRLVARRTAGWAAALVGGALVFGLLADDFAEVTGQIAQLGEMLEQAGFVALDSTTGVVALMLSFLVLGLALYAAAQTAAIRDEEASWRIEPLLVRPLGRTRWLLTRVAVAACAVAVLAAVTALTAWAATLSGDEALTAADAVRAAVNLVPVAWLFLGLGVAVLGIAPRLTAPVTFAAVLGAYLADLLAAMLELPDTVAALSPFRHLAAAPAEPVAVPAALVMVAIGAAATAAGLTAFRRRDLREA